MKSYKFAQRDVSESKMGFISLCFLLISFVVCTFFLGKAIGSRLGKTGTTCILLCE